MTGPADSLTDAQMEQVIDLIADGLGVEDIRVRTGVSEDAVREVVKAMRVDGLMRDLFGGGDG